MSETLSLLPFAVYAFVPSGLNATRRGVCPTPNRAISVFVFVSITETLLRLFGGGAGGPLLAFATQISLEFGRFEMPSGSVPTWITVRIAFVVVSIAVTV